jgi:hypothetical protein
MVEVTRNRTPDMGYDSGPASFGDADRFPRLDVKIDRRCRRFDQSWKNAASARRATWRDHEVERDLS